MNTLLEKWVNSSDLYWTNALDTDIRCHNESHCLFNIDVDDAHWVYVTDIFVVKIKEKKKTSTTKLSWTIYNGFRHSKDYKKFESFRHLTEVNSLTFFSLFFQHYLENGMLKRNFLIKCSPSFLHDNVKSRTNSISIRNIRSNLVVWIRRKLTNRYIFNQVFHNYILILKAYVWIHFSFLFPIN